MKRILIVCCLVSLATPLFVLAQEPLVGDRPDFTESAVTITPGRIQVEGGFTRATAGEVKSSEIGELLGRFGVAQNTEIRLGVASWVDVEAGPIRLDGFSDSELGLKQRLIQGDGATPTMALLASISLPFGNKDISDEKVQPTLLAAAEWELSETIGLGSNLGWAYNYDKPDDAYYSNLWLSAALGFSLSDSWGLFVEGYGFTKEDKDGDSTGYADFGVTWQIDRDFQLDARYGRGFNGLSDDWFAGAGFVWRI